MTARASDEPNLPPHNIKLEQALLGAILANNIPGTEAVFRTVPPNDIRNHEAFDS